MVKMTKVLNGKKKTSKDELFRAVKELSKKIGEYPNTSTFITVEDAMTTGSDIFLITGRPEEKEKENIEREFIPA
jgi:hypothetical protein